MSENFVRKTLNVKNIKAKETYTLHDLDLVETEDGHVYIRIKNKNTEFNNEGDRFAYLYELTNAVRSLNQIELTNEQQLENISNLNLPLVMDVQHLVGEIQVTIAGNTETTFKVNGQAGTFSHGVTTYTVTLPGNVEELPNIVIKEGNKVLATYEKHYPDLEQTQPQHPGYILGSDSYRTFRTSVRARLDVLENHHFDLVKNREGVYTIHLYCKTPPTSLAVYDNATLTHTESNFVLFEQPLPSEFHLYGCDLGTIPEGHSILVVVNNTIVFAKTTV